MKKSLILTLTLLTLTAPAQNSITFGWNPSLDVVAGYKLYLNKTNNLGSTNGLTLTTPITNYLFNINNEVFVTVYDTNNIESEPSNSLFIYRPTQVINLGYSNLTHRGLDIFWAHTSSNVNNYYVFVGTNKISSLTNNSLYLDATNLVRSVTNSINIVGYNSNRTNNEGIYVLESPNSTNLNIVLPPRPPSLRINVIVQSTTNLLSWVDVAKFEYLAFIKRTNENFRARLEIGNN